MSDEIPVYAPGHHRTIPPRTPQPGEEVWRLRQAGRTQSCELRDDSRAGLGRDVQLLEDGEVLFSRRCDNEDAARYVAACFRQDTIRVGWIE
jgi:hypothetical protein